MPRKQQWEHEREQEQDLLLAVAPTWTIRLNTMYQI
jgi:hypothetical protein